MAPKMKLRFTLLLSFLFLSTFAIAQDSATPKGAEFKWEETQFDFGKIPQGVPASHEFWFTNTGGDTLFIADVKKTCGCTTPAWTKEPVLPGQRGYVKATYNAAGGGSFQKAVIVTSNTDPSQVSLTLKGEVVMKDVINLEDDSMMKNDAGGQ